MNEDALIRTIEAAIMDGMEECAECSHRPENVMRFWLDANSRACMAEKIVAALRTAECAP